MKSPTILSSSWSYVLCRDAAGTSRTAGTWHATNASRSNDGLFQQRCSTTDATSASDDAIIRCALLNANTFTLDDWLVYWTALQYCSFVADLLLPTSESIDSVVTAFCCGQETPGIVVTVLFLCFMCGCIILGYFKLETAAASVSWISYAHYWLHNYAHVVQNALHVIAAFANCRRHDIDCYAIESCGVQ